jgi:hypothetical protein
VLFEICSAKNLRAVFVPERPLDNAIGLSRSRRRRHQIAEFVPRLPAHHEEPPGPQPAVIRSPGAGVQQRGDLRVAGSWFGQRCGAGSRCNGFKDVHIRTFPRRLPENLVTAGRRLDQTSFRMNMFATASVWLRLLAGTVSPQPLSVHRVRQPSIPPVKN